MADSGASCRWRSLVVRAIMQEQTREEKNRMQCDAVARNRQTLLRNPDFIRGLPWPLSSASRTFAAYFSAQSYILRPTEAIRRSGSCGVSSMVSSMVRDPLHASRGATNAESCYGNRPTDRLIGRWKLAASAASHISAMIMAISPLPRPC